MRCVPAPWRTCRDISGRSWSPARGWSQCPPPSRSARPARPRCRRAIACACDRPPRSPLPRPCRGMKWQKTVSRVSAIKSAHPARHEMKGHTTDSFGVVTRLREWSESAVNRCRVDDYCAYLAVAPSVARSFVLMPQCQPPSCLKHLCLSKSLFSVILTDLIRVR